ncbi:MAG: radical SAM protein [Candidatus Woesearchaeota archaeon]
MILTYKLNNSYNTIGEGTSYDYYGLCINKDNNEFKYYVDKKPDFLNFSQDNEKIRFSKIKVNNNQIIEVSGGEPTLNPKKILFLLDKFQNSKINLISNSKAFSYPKFLSKFSDYDFEITTTFHGGKKYHNEITRSKNAFQLSLKGLENLKKAGKIINLRLIINNENILNLNEFIPILNKIKPNKLYLYFLNNLKINRSITYSEVKIFSNLLVSFIEKLSYEVVFLNLPKCIFNESELHKINFKSSFLINNITKNLKDYPSNLKCYSCDFKDNCYKPKIDYLSNSYSYEFKLNPHKENNKLVYLTGSCNQKCVFCTYDKFLKIDTNDKSREKPFFEGFSSKAQLNHFRIIKRIINNNSKEIMFMGGEPTLNPKLSYYIKVADSLGKNVSINSNGVLLSKKKFVEDLKNSGLKNAIISLHSHIPKKQNNITQIKGNYKKTIRGIENIIDEKIDLNLVHVLFKENYCDFVDFCKFIINRINPMLDESNFHLSISMVKPNRLSPDENKEITPSYDEVFPYLSKGLNLLFKNNIRFSLQNFPLCKIPKKYIPHSTEHNEIKSDYPKRGYKAWIKNRINNNERDKYGNKSKECIGCDSNKFCQGLLEEYFEIYGNQELKKI